VGGDRPSAADLPERLPGRPGPGEARGRRKHRCFLHPHRGPGRHRPRWKVDDDAARDFAERFYAELHARGRWPTFLARERARAAAAYGDESPRSTVLAYLFFGHPRLTVTGLEEDAHAPAPA
jgi:hypothetical protein